MDLDNDLTMEDNNNKQENDTKTRLNVLIDKNKWSNVNLESTKCSNTKSMFFTLFLT